MDKADIPYLSTTQLSRFIESMKDSPVEAAEAYLERIDDLGFKYIAFLLICRREALRAAQDAEQATVQGNYAGPMHGISVAAKDQLWTKVVRSARGSRILADFIPHVDTTGGLPIGLQIGGRRVFAGTVLKVAHPYEQSTSWHTMRSPAAYTNP